MTMPVTETRFLKPDDVPALLKLEQSKWEPEQAADGAVLLKRIQAFPKLSIGAFCSRTGTVLASVFMCPVSAAMFSAPTRWETAASVDGLRFAEPDGRSLFGISLSSNDPAAVKAIFQFFHPHALKAGWRDVYLGSPIPGLRKARRNNPGLRVWEYVHSKRKLHGKEPMDPQLRYYFQKGFTQIVSIHENYFPHAESLDHGVILRGVIPLSRPRPLWKVMPFFLIESLSTVAFWMDR